MLRSLLPVVFLLMLGVPAYASSITILVGDKDGYGLAVAPGANLPCATNPAYVPNGPSTQAPCLAPIHDWRSAAEQIATNGAQLTDTYAALYSGTESDCPNGCTLNSDTGFVLFPFAGQLTSATLTIGMGDFQCEFGPMAADINGVALPFCFYDGYRATTIRHFALTPEMLAAANQAGAVRLYLDHTAGFDPARGWYGSFDYLAFDYFELQAEAVPEPGTFLLFGTGLAALAARRRLRR